MTAKWKQIETYLGSKTMQERKRTKFNINKQKAQMILDLKKDQLEIILEEPDD